MTGRRRLWILGLLAIAALAALNIASFGLDEKYERWRHDRLVRSAAYVRENGRWDRVDSPHAQQLNTVHMALLRSGRVLLIAGSGNVEEDFERGRFQVGIFDPRTGATRVLRVPTDIFCAGHAFLPDGRLLIAGGTSGYELLAEKVTRAGGVLTIPAGGPRAPRFTLPAGTRFAAAATGRAYRTRAAVRVGRRPVRVWVEAEDTSDAAVRGWRTRLVSDAVPPGADARVEGVADYLTKDTRDYAGSRVSYILEPETETFTRVADLEMARWYPTLVGLEDGRVLASSGLDQFGRIVQGVTEVFDPATGRWSVAGSRRTFPTYPALFTTTRPGVLFFSGSNSGYGSRYRGRAPGLWDWRTGAFMRIPGLRDPRMTETSASLLLPPANRQRWMILGGGGVGDSPRSTARTDVVDLRAPEPRFRPGPDLPAPARYPNVVILPDDTTFVTGGAVRYRATEDSAIMTASILDRDARTLRRVADPTVPRSYHSSALLLPDGRVLTTGGDPLTNEDGTGPGIFEKRMEVYSPPYLFRGPRPRLTGGPATLARGATGVFRSPDAARIASARLIRPSAVTHTTDVEQRSIALTLRRRDGAVALTVPTNAGLVPPGWYMLFVVDRDGVPSVARWVRVPVRPA